MRISLHGAEREPPLDNRRGEKKQKTEILKFNIWQTEMEGDEGSEKSRVNSSLIVCRMVREEQSFCYFCSQVVHNIQMLYLKSNI